MLRPLRLQLDLPERVLLEQRGQHAVPRPARASGLELRHAPKHHEQPRHERSRDPPIPEQNTTFLLGTYPSQDGNQTALGSVNAAKAAWHFLQTFTQEFPAYHPNDSRISIATESYVSHPHIVPGPPKH
jgi:hypothetical protein